MADELISCQKVSKGRSIDTGGSSRTFIFEDFAAHDARLSWRDASLVVGANAFECGGRYLWLCWRMPLFGVEANAFRCGGKCHCLVWRQMPFVVEANAIVWCGGKCLLLWRQMPFVVEANAIMCGGN